MAAPASTGAPTVIDTEVHGKALLAATGEMAITLMRTSGSPVVTESKDFSVCIMDRDVRQLAFSGWISFHVSTATLGVEAVLSRLGRDGLRQGDAFLCNDPHTSGAVHQGDVGVVMPYFHEGELVGFGYVNEHVLDIGGSAVSGFAPEARDCFAEALRFPGVRVAREGRLDPEWEAFIATNVRLPGPVLNDIRSMLAALNVGRERLAEVIEREGAERFEELNAAARELSRKAMEERISLLPDGVYESRTWDEYDARGVQEYHALSLTMTIEGGHMDLAFRGDPQVDCNINGAAPSVIGQSWSMLLCQLAWDIPVNSGIREPVSFDLGPPGTIVNAVAPAPVTMSHMETGMRVTRLVGDALSQACALSADPGIAGRVSGQAAQTGSFAVAMGIDRRTGAPAISLAASTGELMGGGAQTVIDGLDSYAAVAMTGTDVPDVEIEESGMPGLILWRRILADTGGPGTYRGGLGTESAWVVLHADEMAGVAMTLFPTIPAQGAAGGYLGAGGSWHVLRDTNVLDLVGAGRAPLWDNLDGRVDPEPAKTASLRMSRGDVFVAVNGGGGGVGDPITRAPELVAKDVADGYVGEAHARASYGVVLGADGAVDASATAERRAAIRRERIGSEPTEAAAPLAAGAAIGMVEGDWRCGSCGHDLGAGDADWWSAARTVEASVVERLADRAMYVRPPAEGAAPALHEHFCPACASALGTVLTVGGGAIPPTARLRPANTIER
jgi:N-methylhydantoinase B